MFCTSVFLILFMFRCSKNELQSQPMTPAATPHISLSFLYFIFYLFFLQPLPLFINLFPPMVNFRQKKCTFWWSLFGIKTKYYIWICCLSFGLFIFPLVFSHQIYQIYHFALFLSNIYIYIYIYIYIIYHWYWALFIYRYIKI